MKKSGFYSLKQEINELSLDPTAKTGLRLGFFLIGLQLIIIALAWLRLPPQIPLVYSRAYGENQLASNWWLWLLPLCTFLIQLVSIRLAVETKPEDRIWTQTLAWLGAIMAFMGIITLVKIIGLMI